MSSFPKKLSSFFHGQSFPHWLVLVLGLGALGLAAVLDPVAPDKPGVSVSGIPIPPLCGFRNATGVPCPGCGLTRSWVAVMHGEITAGFHFHRLGWLVMGYVVLQVLRHGLWLAGPGGRTGLNKWGHRLDWFLVPLVLLLIFNWFPTLLALK